MTTHSPPYTATVVYLHGFASCGSGMKRDKLVEVFGDTHVIAPDLPVNPQAVVTLVTALAKSALQYPLIFVGTSLGGFWANYFAHKFDAPCVLVNPSVSPSISMAAKIGQPFKNYKTGERIEVTHAHVDEFAKLEAEISELYNGALVNVFLAKDDDIIPYENTLRKLKFTNSLVLTDDGGHRYDTQWHLVVDKVKQLASSSSH